MKKAVFGYGGHAREVEVQLNEKVTFFVDDEYSNEICRPLSKFNVDEYEMMIAVSDPKHREKILKKLPENTKFFTFIHPTTQVMDDNIIIGEGSFIGANSILTSNISIGNHSILNRGNHIGHDSIIGDFISMMPGSIISGNVTVNDRVYLGTNSTIIEKTSICSDVIIGANGVVINNIKNKGTYVGVPVKKIK